MDLTNIMQIYSIISVMLVRKQKGWTAKIEKNWIAVTFE